MKDRGWVRMDYASARFAAVACEFFDVDGDCSGHSVGIMDFDPSDPSNHPGDDNGLYEVTSINPIEVLHRGKKIKNPEPDKTAGIVEALKKSREARKCAHATTV